MDYYKYYGGYFPKNIEMASHITVEGDDNPHSHEYFEVFYVLNGSITHITNDKETLLKTGDMVILRGFGKDVHRFRRHENCAHRDVMIAPNLFKSACEYIEHGMYDSIMSTELPPTVHIESVHINYIEIVMQTLCSLPMEQWQIKKPLIHTATTTLLSFLCQPKKDTRLLPVFFNDLLDRFSKPELIKEGLNAIIEPLNYNRIYLCRIFKQYMGMTMTEYLNQIRINYAETYLRNSNMSITNIYNELGFSSSSYFEKLFKDRYNMTPIKYRNFFRAMLAIDSPKSKNKNVNENT